MPEIKPHQTALDFAKRGWYVFPIQPHEKTPFPGFKWRERSTNDPNLVEKAASHPKYADCNWAVDCGKSGLFVVDIDAHKDGLDSYANLPENLKSDLTVNTPKGGLHLYYKGTGPNTVEKIGKGIDTRGEGGYVLIPGSANGDKTPYTFAGQGDPADQPQWVKNLVGEAPEPRKPEADIPITTYDLPHNVETATRYLVEQAPTATEGASGDDTTFKVACKLRDLGLSWGTALDLMSTHWNETKANPPWSADELHAKVLHAYKYAKGQPGNATPEALFPENATLLGDMVNASEIVAGSIPPRKPVLGSRYYTHYVTETVSEGGGSKSTLTMMEAASICTGVPLTGQPVLIKGRTAIFNLEDPMDELERRVAAIQQYFHIPFKRLNGMILYSGYGKNFHLVGPGNGKDLVENTELIKKITQFAIDNKLKLLSIDPLVKCHGLDENNNMAMDKVMVVLARIAQRANCAIGVVHHVRKPGTGAADASGDAHAGRGASSVAAAARVVHTLGVMTAKAAKDRGVLPNERKWYVRLDNAKGNFSPPADSEEWFRRVSVELPQGDKVGVLEPIVLQKTGEVDTETQRIVDAVFKVDFTKCGEKSLNSVIDEMLLAGVECSSKSSLRRSTEKVFELNGGLMFKEGSDYKIILSTGLKGIKTLRRLSAEVGLKGA